MTDKLLTCTMCGHTFDPMEHVSCQACPLQKSCSLTCCPKCGYENINPHQSVLARLVARWLPKERAKRREVQARPPRLSTLAEVPPGSQAWVRGFLPGLSSDRQAQLQAFGLVAGHPVRVLQHSPVTILQIDHTELALETDLARKIEVSR